MSLLEDEGAGLPSGHLVAWARAEVACSPQVATESAAAHSIRCTL